MFSVFVFFFFKQKTAYEIYQCDWSSDVCSSDLGFGESGEGYFRISMTADEKTLSEAAKTIASI